MLFRQKMNIAQLMPIYNITVHENKIYVALNVAKAVGAIRHQHASRAGDIRTALILKKS